MTIVQVGDPVLRRVARSLSGPEITSTPIRRLIDSMKETMRGAPGVGLAAPQVGESLQLAVIEDRAEYTRDWTAQQLAERQRQPVEFHVIINPRLTLLEEDQVEFFEGCLSLSGLMALVPRAPRVRVECLDEQGKAQVIEACGWYARILQHEVDHLQGTVYVDRMYRRTLTTVENYRQHWRMQSPAEVKAALQA